MERQFIPKNAAMKCATCKKPIPHTMTRKEYPKRMPDEFLFAEKECEKREPK